MSKSNTLLEKRKNVIANGVGVSCKATVTTAQGLIIADPDGKDLIDFAGGIEVVDAGLCQEAVVKAIQEQEAKYIPTSFNLVTYVPESYRFPFPNFYWYGAGKNRDSLVKRELKRLHQSTHNVVYPINLAVIIIEPIQGEGGFDPVPQKHLEGLRP
jgi:4-aminobutyrate aminotransferase-like enzyme